MFCRHYYVYEQGYSVCTKCGHRNYGRRYRKRRKIIVPIIVVSILAVLAAIFLDIDFSSKESAKPEQTTLQKTSASQSLLDVLDSQNSLMISDCVMRSNSIDRVIVNCGDFGHAEFLTDNPVRTTIVEGVDIMNKYGKYSLSYVAASGSKVTYTINPKPQEAFPFGDSEDFTLEIPDIKIRTDKIPKIELPKIELEPDFTFITEPIELPDNEFLDSAFKPKPTSIEESKQNIDYINQVRIEKGRNSISFDQRAYDLALARVRDVNEYNYFDHTNPFTGSCPDNMKNQYGFSAAEHPAENLAGGVYSPDSAVDLWMTSQGHRYNLLYSDHISGATVCESGTCVFLGVNRGTLGVGCYTGEEGKAWQQSLGRCTDEQFLQLDRLNQRYDELLSQYERFPQTITSQSQYQQAMQMYHELQGLYNQIVNFRC